jgi:hypothetical protein
MSGKPNISGISQLPKPPIAVGMTIKKIMTKACEVKTALYNCPLLINFTGFPNWSRMSHLKPVPIKPL